jgi:hypothetical protein
MLKREAALHSFVIIGVQRLVGLIQDKTYGTWLKGFVWHRFVIDECHEALGKVTHPALLSLQYQHLWLLSATPLSGSQPWKQQGMKLAQFLNNIRGSSIEFTETNLQSYMVRRCKSEYPQHFAHGRLLGDNVCNIHS